jgi:hypothetical protein
MEHDKSTVAEEYAKYIWKSSGLSTEQTVGKEMFVEVAHDDQWDWSKFKVMAREATVQTLVVEIKFTDLSQGAVV